MNLMKNSIQRNVVTMIIAVFVMALNINAQESKNEKIVIGKNDPWKASQVITPSQLAKELKSKKGIKPVVLHIGFDFLYNQGHVPGSKYIGPATNEKGMNALKNYVKKLKKNANIVIYCGCCPMNHCPNVRPAFEALEKMGYKNAKLLYLPDDFDQDWAQQGYPVQK